MSHGAGIGGFGPRISGDLAAQNSQLTTLSAMLRPATGLKATNMTGLTTAMK
ncbi:hypothetical protein FRC11_012964, partial [Ceratobasidium sp. 423]